jgi:putative exporter of polyketide antibiotics
MSQSDLQRELSKAAVEPLLPIEKKLIGWSLGIGLVLLVILAVINQLVPVTL